MKEFKQYHHLERFGTTAVSGIEFGTCARSIQWANITRLRLWPCFNRDIPGNCGIINIKIGLDIRRIVGIAIVCVVNILPGDVAEKFEEEFFALIFMTQVALWCRH
jgi:hypothetical protein